MGDHGVNAGGFAYMDWVICRLCRRKFPIGRQNSRRTCSNQATCRQRQIKQAATQPSKGT